jgi:hypothetical protein
MFFKISEINLNFDPHPRRYFFNFLPPTFIIIAENKVFTSVNRALKKTLDTLDKEGKPFLNNSEINFKLISNLNFMA